MDFHIIINLPSDFNFKIMRKTKPTSYSDYLDQNQDQVDDMVEAKRLSKSTNSEVWRKKVALGNH